MKDQIFTNYKATDYKPTTINDVSDKENYIQSIFNSENSIPILSQNEDWRINQKKIQTYSDRFIPYRQGIDVMAEYMKQDESSIQQDRTRADQTEQ